MRHRIGLRAELKYAADSEERSADSEELADGADRADNIALVDSERDADVQLKARVTSVL